MTSKAIQSKSASACSVPPIVVGTGATSAPKGMIPTWEELPFKGETSIYTHTIEVSGVCWLRYFLDSFVLHGSPTMLSLSFLKVISTKYKLYSSSLNPTSGMFLVKLASIY